MEANLAPSARAYGLPLEGEPDPTGMPRRAA